MGLFDGLKKVLFGGQDDNPSVPRQTGSSSSGFKIQPGPCDVILQDEGRSKIECIKAIRAIRSDLGLKEAKEFCESAPQLLLNDVSEKIAKQAMKILRGVGAKAELKTKADKPKVAKPKKKSYQPPSTDKTIVIEYLNYAGELKQFIGDPKSIVRKGNHFSIRVAPTFKRISLNRSKTRILKGVPVPTTMPAEPAPVRTTTSETSIIQYTNFEGVKKEFTIITGVVDDKGDYVRVRVSPTFKYITLKRTRIGNPEALFESVPSEPTLVEEVTPTEPEPTKPEEPVAEIPTGMVDIVLTGCGLATYDATAVMRDLRPDLGTLDIYGLLRDFPKTAAESVTSEKAKEYKKRFEDAGCTVEIHAHGAVVEEQVFTEASELESDVEETGSQAEPEPTAAKSATMDVVITGCGISTYDAQKILQELNPGTSYFEIYKLLRDFPQVASENLPPKEAEEIKTKLEAANCTVELRAHGS